MTLLPKTFPVTCHTDYIQPGGTFVAIPGYTTHGAAFVATAIERGATTVILQKDDAGVYNQLCHQGLVDGVRYVLVPCARRALAEQSAIAANNAAQKLTIIGITGTKGKTTTANLVVRMLEAARFKVAVLGTIENCIAQKCESSPLTTPSSDYLHQFFAQCVDERITHVVMEVSAHALSLHRVHGINFSHVVFTNFGADHQDFFGTLPRYLAAKKKIFTQCADNGTAHLLDSPVCRELSDVLPKDSRVLSNRLTHAQADNQMGYEVIEDSFERLSLTVYEGNKQYELATAQPGRYNAQNIVLAVSVARACGLDWQVIARAVRSWTGVPGRLEMHTTKRGVRVVIDFAHDPLSVETVLAWLREQTEHLTVVLGCGGDRDNTKRGPMGAAAAHYADVLVLTSDNPRTEEPMNIIEQIRVGVQGEQSKDANLKLVVEPDRKKAIELACQKLARPDGVVAVLGKGHEAVQIIGTIAVPLRDADVVEKMC